MALSQDLRTRVVRLSESGMNQQAIASHLMIAQSSVSRILNRYRKGNLKAGSPPGRPRSFTESDDAFIFGKIKEQPDITYRELIEAVKNELGKTVSTQSIVLSLQRLKLTRKKRLTMIQQKNLKVPKSDELRLKNGHSKLL